MEAPVTINIALAGDHALNLHALAILLEQEPQFRIVAICKGASQLASSIASGGEDWYPHIVLLDVNFDLHQAVGIITFLKAAHPTIRIAALGLTKDRRAINRLLNLGGDCYIPKNSDPRELEDVLRQLGHAGGPGILPTGWTSGVIGDADCGDASGAGGKVAGDVAREGGDAGGKVAGGIGRDGGDAGGKIADDIGYERGPDAIGDWPSVTASERRFFKLALSEASDEDIRRRMNLCKSTFTQLVARVYRIFGVRSRDGLVLALYRSRFVILDDL